MDYSFIIRRAEATELDAKAVHVVMQEAFRKYREDTGLPGIPEALQESVEDILRDIREQYVYLAFVDGVPVGSIRIAIQTENRTAYISRFGVRADYRNIGIGKSFINLVDKLLRSKGVKKACLHTASQYTALVRFYYGCGFYIHSTSVDRGYIRALFVKDYEDVV